MRTSPVISRDLGAARRLAAALGALVALAAPAGAAADSAPAYLSRLPQDEVIYFVLPDRFENADSANDQGGLEGDRLATGFDPSHKGFFHGGDLKGLTARLDYIEGLGATAIWLGPIYKNKPVQGPPGEESAGYHGYWITDFTTVDPHFGTADDMRAFVDAAHARGIKVYLDIITNHTADVIRYRECHDPHYEGADKPAEGCPYRGKADFPFSTRGPAGGEKINPGFMGDAPPFQTQENFEKLVRQDYAYTPFVPESEKDVKVPDWLNDPRYYHNRGDSNWIGESALYGDFSGLDDIMTEHPRAVEGFIEIFSDWISKYKIDGFRVDTARHVDPEFWRAFTDAMLKHADSEGIPNFYIFGEAFRDTYRTDPGQLTRFTRVDGFPAVLDFGFQAALQDVMVDGAPTSRFADLFAIDDVYEGGQETALALPVFTSNHDMGRFAMFARQSLPSADDTELRKRVELAYAMIFFLRGAPVIYYGDEQGFNGDGNDQASREDMFPSKVDSYNDNDLIGADKTTAVSNFDRRHPLYRSIRAMAGIFRQHETLRRGAQIVREAERDGGVLAVSRLAPEGGEYLVVFNTENASRSLQIAVDPRSTSWKSVHGKCGRASSVRGSYRVEAPPLAYVICKSNDWSETE